MSNINVREVTSKADKLKFVRMVWDIYGDDPNWVPPMEMDRMKMNKPAEGKSISAEFRRIL